MLFAKKEVATNDCPKFSISSGSIPNHAKGIHKNITKIKAGNTLLARLS
jgi:hypothetical protein